MHYHLTFSSTLGHEQVKALVNELQKASPFAEIEPEQTGSNRWNLILSPRHAAIHYGFASVAEYQLNLSRSVEIEMVSRINSELLAVAS